MQGKKKQNGWNLKSFEIDQSYARPKKYIFLSSIRPSTPEKHAKHFTKLDDGNQMLCTVHTHMWNCSHFPKLFKCSHRWSIHIISPRVAIGVVSTTICMIDSRKWQKMESKLKTKAIDSDRRRMICVMEKYEFTGQWIRNTATCKIIIMIVLRTKRTQNNARTRWTCCNMFHNYSTSIFSFHFTSSLRWCSLPFRFSLIRCSWIQMNCSACFASLSPSLQLLLLYKSLFI